MPSLETPDGKAVDVTPVDADAVNAQFNAAMNDDGPDDAAPPKRQPKTGSQDATPSRPRRTPKSEKSRTTSKPATVLGDDARRDGVKGIAQLGAGLCMVLSKATAKNVKGSDGKVTRQDNEAYQADAITIASAAGDIADACVATAKADARFAAALDKVCNVGPYGALIGVGVGLVSQLVRNHRPAASIPGTVDPSELLAAAAQPTAA